MTKAALLILLSSCTQVSPVTPPSSEASSSPVVQAASAAPVRGTCGGGPLEPALRAGRYMCQLAMAGAWEAPYPCEVVESPDRTEYEAYLRFTKHELPCSATGRLTGARVDGDIYCAPRPGDAGREVLYTGTFAPIAGGLRLETRAEVNTLLPRPDGKVDDLLRTELVTLVVCRQPWPAGFESDHEKAARKRAAFEALHPGVIVD